MKKFLPAILLATLCPLAFAEVGVITHLDPDLKSVTIVESAGEPRIYFITEQQRLRIKAMPGFAQVQAGNEADFSYRATNEGRELTLLTVAHPEVVQDTVPYIIRESRSVSGQIVGTRDSEMALVLRQEDRTRRTFKVGEDAVIKKDGQSIRFRDLNKGDLITATYSQNEQGAFLFSSTMNPAVVIPAEPVEVAMSMPDRLPTTGSLYPLIALIGLFAGAGAVAVSLYRRS